MERVQHIKDNNLLSLSLCVSPSGFTADFSFGVPIINNFSQVKEKKSTWARAFALQLQRSKNLPEYNRVLRISTSYTFLFSYTFYHASPPYPSFRIDRCCVANGNAEEAAAPLPKKKPVASLLYEQSW